MYGLSNGWNTNDLEGVWRLLLLLQVRKLIVLTLCDSRASRKFVFPQKYL